jgi:hypothetical protein
MAVGVSTANPPAFADMGRSYTAGVGGPSAASSPDPFVSWVAALPPPEPLDPSIAGNGIGAFQEALHSSFSVEPSNAPFGGQVFAGGPTRRAHESAWPRFDANEPRRGEPSAVTPMSPDFAPRLAADESGSLGWTRGDPLGRNPASPSNFGALNNWTLRHDPSHAEHSALAETVPEPTSALLAGIAALLLARRPRPRTV